MATSKKRVSRVSRLKTVQPERAHMHLMLLENPNYFGTLAKSNPLAKKYKAVKKIQGNTTYEEIKCVGYNPQMKTLTAIIKINQDGGYSGTACTDGSKEYIRFYIDYERNGNWQDAGIVSFDAHDFNNVNNDPLCYAVNQAIEPELTRCCDDTPVLPAVRAILSWNVAPTAGDPDFVPVWGNIVNINAQLEPRKGWTCWLKKNLKDIGVTLKPEQLIAFEQQLPEIPEILNLKTIEHDLAGLTKVYKKKVEDERIGFTTVAKAINAGVPLYDLTTNLKNAGLNISKIIDFVAKPKFNTSYEEVKCVGLNRDTNRLYATIHVKKSSGYSGNLCSNGSREYVGFYMDFGSGWQHMGTTSVAVHDITPMPNGGLTYHVELPVNLAPHQKIHCHETYFAKVKAILSWNQYPPDNQPDWVAPWGDWEQAWVEIRNRGLMPTGKKPIVTTIGNIPTKKINDLTGMVDKNLDAPEASIDAYDGFAFNGSIPLSGLIPDHPDSNDISSAQLKYRIMMKRAGDPDSKFAPLLNSFKVLKNVISGGILTQSVVTQTPDASGFYNYIVDFQSPKIVTVHGDLFGVLTMAESDVYEFYLETSEGFVSARHRVKVDKTPPKDVTIEVNGSEDCGTLIKGNDITGKYSIDDDENNCHSVLFQFISLRPGDSTTFKADGNVSSFGTQIPVPLTGKNGTWSMTTNNVRKCGYNIRLYAYDKTLLCYAFTSYAYAFRQQRSVDTIGFCLNEA